MTQYYGWDQPKSRDVGLFTDLTLYAEALQLAADRGAVNASFLQQELSQRMLKLRLVERQSLRVAQHLVRELRLFGWFQPEGKTTRSPVNAPHTLTQKGSEALAESSRDSHAFRRRLAVQMHRVYVIPGWFVSRLWQINSEGQGELILPAPLPGWKPQSRDWDDCEWSVELEEQTVDTATQARHASSDAFPVKESDWVFEVRNAWERLSVLSPRGRKARIPTRSFRPRDRLARAMREAAVKLLFSEVPYRVDQTSSLDHLPLLYPRTFMAWCPRLESLEFIFYTDWHPKVHGRVLFPTAVFRAAAPPERFEAMSQIVHPDGSLLYLHQPTWSSMRDRFQQTLTATHHRISLQVNSLYVSLLDVRDEVCRQLRLSAVCFDQFVSHMLQEPARSDFSISIETDIREEQRSGYGLLRRPVYIRGVPHTLIAIAHLPEAERSQL